MQKTILPTFEGRENVTCVISDTGNKAYLTKSVPLKEEVAKLGGCKLNTIDTDIKHVLFVFNSKDEEVKRYYLGKKLQGKTPKELMEMMDLIVAFESFNPKTKEWVPCVGMLSRKSTETDYEKKDEERVQKDVEKQTPSSVSYYQRYNDWYPKESREREKEEEEYRNYSEYGTNDSKKIEKIKKERENEEKSSCIAKIFLFVLLFVLPIFIMGLVQKCTGSKYNPLEDNTPWSPRHTQLQKPSQNNVNSCTFHTFAI